MTRAEVGRLRPKVGPLRTVKTLEPNKRLNLFDKGRIYIKERCEKE